MPEIIRRYRMITLRLFGQQEHSVDHSSSVSFGCSSENCKRKLHVTAIICLYSYERKNKKRITPRSRCSSHSPWGEAVTRKIWISVTGTIYIYIYIYIYILRNYLFVSCGKTRLIKKSSLRSWESIWSIFNCTWVDSRWQHTVHIYI